MVEFKPHSSDPMSKKYQPAGPSLDFSEQSAREFGITFEAQEKLKDKLKLKNVRFNLLKRFSG
jgi:hypothetical protein